MLAWHIDAMDVLGGLAFASLRKADLLDQDVNLDIPGFVFAAPDFRPEPLASRALAFASVRRGFQLGLWLNQEELSFANLETVGEFVRRSYVAAAGRGGGGGGETPPYPEGGTRGPEGPTSPEHIAGDDLRDFLTTLKGFDGSASKSGSPVDLIELTPVQWLQKTFSPTLQFASAALCDRALALILQEVLRRRVPVGQIDHMKWCTSLAASLELIFDVGGADQVEEVIKKNERLLESFAQVRHIGWLVEILSHKVRFWGGPSRVGYKDPIRLLQVLPIGKQAAEALGHRTPERASLFDGMRIMSADPSAVVKAGSTLSVHDCLAMLFLSAVVIVRAALPSASGPGQFPEPDQMFDSEKIWDWLISQMPVGSFPKEVEQLIGRVGRVDARSEKVFA